MRGLMLVLVALAIGCGGTQKVEETPPVEKEIESTGDCPSCTRPDFDSPPPGAIPQESAAQPSESQPE
jgi:hypothetical protein